MTTVGIIGTGNMGAAIARGLAGRGDVALIGIDQDQSRLDELRDIGLEPADSAEDLAARSDLVLVAVKPNQVESVLSEISSSLTRDKCIVSIAAGLRMDKLTAWSGRACPVVRVMPNTPALVGKGCFAVCLDDPGLSDAQRQTITGLFASLGKVFELPEKDFDAFTAVVGSGPAYVFYFMEALMEAAVAQGLARDQATQMVKSLFEGSAELALKSDKHVSILREMVTSPGGTTIAALNVLDAEAVRSAIIKAVKAACQRSRELG